MAKFPANSRYAHSVVLTHVDADGTERSYLARRIIPETERYTPLAHHRSQGGERVDLVAAAYYGDSEQYWRICDANAVQKPAGATGEDGQIVTIPLPLEISGRGNA